MVKLHTVGTNTGIRVLATLTSVYSGLRTTTEKITPAAAYYWRVKTTGTRDGNRAFRKARAVRIFVEKKNSYLRFFFSSPTTAQPEPFVKSPVVRTTMIAVMTPVQKTQESRANNDRNVRESATRRTVKYGDSYTHNRLLFIMIVTDRKRFDCRSLDSWKINPKCRAENGEKMDQGSVSTPADPVCPATGVLPAGIVGRQILMISRERNNFQTFVKRKKLEKQ